MVGLAKAHNYDMLFFLLCGEVTLSFFPTDITIFPCTLILIPLPRLTALDLGFQDREDIGSSVH